MKHWNVRKSATSHWRNDKHICSKSMRCVTIFSSDDTILTEVKDGRLWWARNGQRIDTTAEYSDSRLGD